MAKCHDNRKKRLNRVRRAQRRTQDQAHIRRTQLPAGYCIASRSHGFALYADSWDENGRCRADTRIGGYGVDEFWLLLEHAWDDYDRKNTEGD